MSAMPFQRHHVTWSLDAQASLVAHLGAPSDEWSLGEGRWEWLIMTQDKSACMNPNTSEMSKTTKGL